MVTPSDSRILHVPPPRSTDPQFFGHSLAAGVMAVDVVKPLVDVAVKAVESVVVIGGALDDDVNKLALLQFTAMLRRYSMESPPQSSSINFTSKLLHDFGH